MTVSKAAQTRAAEKVLYGLLRTPKTRAGLVAAVTRGKISRNFVYGWLAKRRSDGTLTIHKSSGVLMYQITAVVQEKPAESIYPAWLDPRTLPVSTSRIVAVDGVVIKGREE